MEVTAAEMLDMPQEQFEKAVRDNMKMNLGDASNLTFFLQSTFAQSVAAKNMILSKVKSGEVDSGEADKNLKDLYLLMQDIENKVIFMKSYIKSLTGGK